jgi:hypothetical protein
MSAHTYSRFSWITSIKPQSVHSLAILYRMYFAVVAGATLDLPRPHQSWLVLCCILLRSRDLLLLANPRIRANEDSKLVVSSSLFKHCRPVLPRSDVEVLVIH